MTIPTEAVVYLCIKRIGWGLAVMMGLTIGASQVHAGLLPDHAYAVGDLTDATLPHGSSYGFTFAGAGPFSGSATSSPLRFHYATAYANGGSALFTSQSSITNPYGGASGANSGAEWRDVTSLSGVGTPSTIRMEFAVTALLASSTSDNSQANNFAIVGFGKGSFNPGSLGDLPAAGTWGDVPAGNYNPYIPANALNAAWSTAPTSGYPINGGGYGSNWDTASLNITSLINDPVNYQFSSTATFTGTFHLDVPYSSVLGGYGWDVSLATNTSAASGAASASASLDLISISSGGVLFSGSQLSFDSGVSFPSVVPEPSSLISTALGLVTCLATIARHRRLLRGRTAG